MFCGVFFVPEEFTVALYVIEYCKRSAKRTRTQNMSSFMADTKPITEPPVLGEDHLSPWLAEDAL